MQAGQCLTAIGGYGALEARICYERAEALCHSLGRPLLLCVALINQWRYSLMTEKLTAAMQIARRVYSLAQEQNDAALTSDHRRSDLCSEGVEGCAGISPCAKLGSGSGYP